MSELLPLTTSPDCALYAIADKKRSRVERFIATTPQTRAICNDPGIAGVRYTTLLRDGCTAVLKDLPLFRANRFAEHDTCVFHILRGGLNFGLREALAQAHNWNNHSSAFVSAQRVQDQKNPDHWYITESNYKKLEIPNHSLIVFGDVVATGTSLSHGLQTMVDSMRSHGKEIGYLLFFTIGGARSEEIVEEYTELCVKHFKSFVGAAVVYLEGRFSVATKDTAMRIKLPGTDLLRTGCLMAPEFIESQYENPAYPLERCTIYDAGSRAFSLSEYYKDVRSYWKLVLELSESGLEFSEYLTDRMPEADLARFSRQNLAEIASTRLAILNY